MREKHSTPSKLNGHMNEQLLSSAEWNALLIKSLLMAKLCALVSSPYLNKKKITQYETIPKILPQNGLMLVSMLTCVSTHVSLEM